VTKDTKDGMPHGIDLLRSPSDGIELWVSVKGMLIRYHNYAHSPRCGTWFALEARLWFCWRFVVMGELSYRWLPVLAVPPLLCSPFRFPSLSPLALYLSSAHRNDRSRCR